MSLTATTQVTVDCPDEYADSPKHRVVYRAIASGIAQTDAAIIQRTGFAPDMVEDIITDLLMTGYMYEPAHCTYKSISEAPTATIYIRG